MKRRTERPVLFLDETNHGPSISEPLRREGLDIVCIHEVFPPGTKDEVWIPHAAKNGWAIITKDRAQDVNPLELLLLYRHDAKRYLLSERALRGGEIAQRIITYYRKIENTFNSQPAPFVYTIRKTGLNLSISANQMKKRLKGLGLL